MMGCLENDDLKSGIDWDELLLSHVPTSLFPGDKIWDPARGVEEGFYPVVVLFTVHFPVGQWTIDFRCKLCCFFFNINFSWGRGGGTCFMTCFPKGSQYHLTFIPYALANAVLLSPIYLGQTEETLCMKIEPSLWESLHSFILVG